MGLTQKIHFITKRVCGLSSWTYSFRSLKGNFYPSHDSFARIFTPKRNSSFQRGKNSPVYGLPRSTGSNSKNSSRLLGNAYFASRKIRDKMTGYPKISLCPLKKHVQLYNMYTCFKQIFGDNTISIVYLNWRVNEEKGNLIKESTDKYRLKNILEYINKKEVLIFPYTGMLR